MENQLKINHEKIKILDEESNKLNKEISKSENKHCNEVKNISNFYKNKFEHIHANSLDLKAK